jgi:hypothetical protein
MLTLFIVYHHPFMLTNLIYIHCVSDIIGVISDVGPYENASPTSQKKLRRIQIRNLEYVLPATIATSFYFMKPFLILSD